MHKNNPNPPKCEDLYETICKVLTRNIKDNSNKFNASWWADSVLERTPFLPQLNYEFITFPIKLPMGNFMCVCARASVCVYVNTHIHTYTHIQICIYPHICYIYAYTLQIFQNRFWIYLREHTGKSRFWK